MQREGQPLLPTSTKNTTVSSNALSLPSQYPRGFTPPTQHNEQHRMNAEVLRDAIIGLADGLTVPFALAAGLSGLYDNNLVVIAGFAELLAGAISMGLGGYLASKSEIDHFDAERAREEYEIVHFPQAEEQEIVDIFEPYGLSRDEIQPILKKLKSNPKAYVDFMMKFELNLERPSEWRSTISAATIGLAYFFGGLLPLLPYLLTTDTIRGLAFSSIVTLFALYVFGIFRARFIGLHSVHKSAFQTLGIGAVAAGGSFALVKLMG